MNWKRVALWTSAAVALLLLIVAAAVVYVLRSPDFHRYALMKAEQQVSEALNAQVRVREFSLRLAPLTLDLYDVTVHGTEAASAAPLLQVEHVNLGVQIISFLHAQWNLSNVVVDHPVIHVYVDADGNTNLPKQKPTAKKKTNIFDLAVKHAVLNGGELYYNDRKSPIEAELHDLHFESGYDQTAGGRYSGELGYRDGRLRFASYAPVPHDLTANFDARRDAMRLDPVLLSLGESRLKLAATVNNYADPVVDATYDATISATEARRILKVASLPQGAVNLNGTMHYQNLAGMPLLECLSTQGTVASRKLEVQQTNLRAGVNDLTARYRLEHGDAIVEGLRAKLFGGDAVGNVRIDDVAGEGKGRADLKLTGVSVSELRALAGRSLPPDVSFTGRVDADTAASWKGGMEALVADVNAKVDALAAQGTTPANDPQVPVSGVLHAHYDRAKSEITLSDSSLSTPQTQAQLNGTVSENSALQVNLQARDLSELETISNMFRPAAAKTTTPPLDLRGRASFTGTVTGATNAPVLNGQLRAQDMQVRGTAWRQLRADIAASPSRLTVQGGELDPAGQGRITFALQTGLNKWAYAPTNPLKMSLDATQISVSDLARMAALKTPVIGVLNAKVNVQGSQLNPVGQGRLAITDARVAQETVQAVNVAFEGTGEVVHATLSANIPAGAAHGVLTYYPKQQSYEFSLQAPSVRLDQVQTPAVRRMAVAGTLSLAANGRGTVRNPQMEATVQIPDLTVRKQEIRGLKLATRVENHVATADLTSEVANTYVRGHGALGLEGSYPVDATFDTQAIPLQPLLAMYLPEQSADFAGQTELHATVRGPLKNRTQIEAHVSVPSFNVRYKTIELAAAQPIRADYANGVLVVQRSQIRGTGTDLQFQGNIPVVTKEPASLLLQGTVDLKLAQLVRPDVESSGQLQFDINSYGTRNPQIKGQIRVVEASLLPVDSPVGLTHGNGVLTLGTNRLDVTKFQGQVGGGTVTAQGGIVYRPALQFDVAFSGTGIGAVYNGIRTGADAKLTLTGTPQSSLLRGQVRVTRVSFTPDFELASFVGQFSGAPAAVSPEGFAQNCKLNISVVSSSELNLVSRIVSVRGSTNLRVTGTAADPVILGRANLTGGDLLFGGNRYVVEGGTVDFMNPIRTQPTVNLAVSTTINEYNINMRFQGPVDRLQTNYTSDPSLPPVDIINLLAFGKTTEASAANPNSSSSLGAESVLASGISSQVTSRVEKLAGISHLTIDPTLGSNTQNPGARVAVQQRVTGNLFVTFATDLTSTQRQQIQVEYRFSRKWSVSGVRDQNGGFGFDAKVHREF